MANYRDPFEWCAKCGHEMCFPNTCNPCAKFVTSMCEIFSRSFRNWLWPHQQSDSLPVVIYSFTGAKYKSSVFPNNMQTTVSTCEKRLWKTLGYRRVEEAITHCKPLRGEMTEVGCSSKRGNVAGFWWACWQFGWVHFGISNQFVFRTIFLWMLWKVVSDTGVSLASNRPHRRIGVIPKRIWSWHCPGDLFSA